MLQHGVVEDIALGIKAHQHLQLTAETHGDGLNSRTNILTLFRSGIDGKAGTIHLLHALLRNGVVVKTGNYSLYGLTERFGISLSNRSLGQFIHVGQQRNRNHGDSCQYQQHIR